MRSSWATITEVKPHVWRIRYWANGRDGYKRRSKTVRGTRKDAERERSNLMLNHAEDMACPTLEQAFNAWYLPDITAQVEAYEKYGNTSSRRGSTMKRTTYEQYLSTWRTHVQPEFGSRTLDSIRYSEVQDWLYTKTEQTAVKCIVVMRETFRFAMLNEVIDKNILEYSYRMPVQAKKAAHGVYTFGELCKLWHALEGTPIEGAFIMAAFVGCRTGEALGVKLSDIESVNYKDMEFAAIEIKRQANNVGEVSRDNDLKNKWSVRTVVVPPPFSARLREIKTQQEQKGYVYLSDNYHGAPITQMVLRRDFAQAIERAQVHEEQFRSLRRSWRTWVSAQGISSELIEKLMGHVGSGTTGKNYLKPYKQILIEEYARALEQRPIIIE